MRTKNDTIPDSTKQKPPTLPPVVLIMLFMSMLLQPVFAETGQIYLTLTSALKLSEAKAISFGNIIASGDAAVTVSPSGTRTITGDAISQDNIASEGAFGVTGAPMSDFIVTFGSAHCKSGTSSIVVDGFKTNLSLNAGTTDSNGKAVFYVGATARITIQNKSGSYVGTYEVTCAYQ